MTVHRDHPYFSGTEAEWVPITNVSLLGDEVLAEIVVAEQDRIAQCCTRILGKFVHQELIVTGTLTPQEFLIKPMGNPQRGFVSYLDFILPSSQPCDSDSWWIIVGCPDTTKTFFPEIQYNPWSLGWFCQ